MDCREIEFCPDKSRARIAKAMRVFPPKVLNKILAFALHILGAKRRVVAAFLDMPEDSVKTTVRVVLRDGFPALRDRRGAAAPCCPEICVSSLQVSVRREDGCFVVGFGSDPRQLSIPLTHKIEARTILLSLLNADLLSTQEVATTLGLSCAHCRELAGNLSRCDVMDALADKRRGQQQDYLVGPEKKAELIRQFTARTITGHSTSSEVLAELVNAQSEVPVSPRTVRWHISKLGLSGISKTLPKLVSTLKKTHDGSS